jgi:phosphate transport system substrate-binding protein
VTISTLRRSSTAAVVLTLALSISACSSKSTGTAATGASTPAGSSGSGATGSLSGSGSTAQQAAMTAWQAGFQTSHPGVTINYDPVGSGGGRDAFLGGAVAFAGSDAALAAADLTKSKTTSTCTSAGAIDIPVYLSAIAIVYKLNGVTDLKLSASTLAKIFNQKITTWNDPAIAADNAGVTLPSSKITVVNRSDKSGTTKNFTDYLSKAAAADWTYPAADVWPVSGGEAANGTSGVIQAVSGNDGTIGYADLSQAKDLGVASIKVGTEFVKPSADSAAKVLDESKKADTATGNDLAYTINRTPTGSGVYPIVLLSYHFVCQEYKDANMGQLVKDFESYVTSAEGQAAAAKTAGSAPLGAALLATIKTSVDSIKAG